MPDGTSLYFEEVLEGKKNTSLRAKTLYKKDKLISDEVLLNIISSNTNRMNVSNSKIVTHEGVAVSPLIQHNNTGAVAISATHEQLNNDISEFVDKSITNYVNSKIQTYIVNSQTYGFVHNGKIYLNPEIMNSNAAVHEYTHLWDAYTQKTNPELWNKGLDIFKDTKYWNEVISDPNYQDIKDDENLVLSEIHSRICGDIAEKVLERIAELDGEQVKLDAIDWNKEICNYVAENFLANSYSYALFTAEEIDKKSLSSDELKQYELTKEHYKNFSFATIVPEAVNAYNFHNKGKYAALRELADIQNNFYKEFLSTPMKDLINEKNITQGVNMENSVTNEILDKIKAAGIEVVTDKDEFDRILGQEDRLQKMAGKSPKWLTVDDVKTLSSFGYKNFDEIRQIQEAILVSSYELNEKVNISAVLKHLKYI